MNQETRNYELEKELKEAEKEIKETDKSISHKIWILIFTVGLLAVLVFILVISFANIVIDNGKRVEQDSITISEKKAEISALLDGIEAKDNKIDMLSNKVESLEAMLADTNDELEKQKEINKDLYNDNKGLKEYTESFDSQIDELKDRIEKYEKYDWALFNRWTRERNDLNYDYIKELETLTAYKPVNDIDFYLSWIMLESEGNSTAKNPNSSAKGFGQFLDGTSKSVYNTYLADKYNMDWYPEIVTDHPDIALDMMVEYVNYLYIECSRSIPAVIDCYRGLHDEPYINSFNKLLANSGKSIDSINTSSEEHYQELLVAVG